MANANTTEHDPTRALVRALLLQALTEYREEGLFPHNHLHAARTPVFVDAHGSPCAVGHLLALTGQHALVEHIATQRNYDTIAQLADEPALVAWLEDAGISLAEAALIQPGYSNQVCGQPDQCFCQPYGDRDAASSRTVTAVLDCTMTSADVARIDRIHGSTQTHAVGGLLTIAYFRGEASTTRVLVPVAEDGAQSVTWMGPTLLPGSYMGIGVQADGMASCSTQGLNVSTQLVTRVRAESVTTALLSTNCYTRLAALEPESMTRQCAGCACSAPAQRLNASESAGSLALLLTLVGALSARKWLARTPRAHATR
ncbi:MAG: hypothetical protein Q8Q09_14350 [Deltaproteobacteria bacterium]|nr:hypothetical protein [Deltaproteobacteria bacterium]